MRPKIIDLRNVPEHIYAVVQPSDVMTAETERHEWHRDMLIRVCQPELLARTDAGDTISVGTLAIVYVHPVGETPLYYLSDEDGEHVVPLTDRGVIAMLETAFAECAEYYADYHEALLTWRHFDECSTGRASDVGYDRMGREAFL